MAWQSVSYKNGKPQFDGVVGRDNSVPHWGGIQSRDKNKTNYYIKVKDDGIEISTSSQLVFFFTRENFSEIFNTVLFHTGLYKKPEGYDNVSPWITTKKPKPKDLYPRHT